MFVVFKETIIFSEVAAKFFGKSWKGFSYGEQWNSSRKNVILTISVYGGVDFVLNVNWVSNKYFNSCSLNIL